MSDQQAPPSGDTPAVAGPEQAPGTAQEQPQVDWEKRYQDLQPEYTRTTQQLRELEQQKQWYELAVTSADPDTQRQALEALGYELPEEHEEPEPAEYQDPYEELLARQQALEQRIAQGDQTRQQEQEANLIREIADERLSRLEGLAPEDQDLVLAYAVHALPPVREPGVPVPLPDVAKAFEVFQAREVERQKSWASTKRAPYVPPGGQPATEVPLPRNATHDQRVAFAMQKVAEQQEPQ